MAETHQEEHLDVLSKTWKSKPRGDVHRGVHVWIFAESTQELLLQRRAVSKDSWPGLWDISSAGHISAGGSSLTTVRREFQEELGTCLPKDAFELIFVFLQECVTNHGKFTDNEYNDVYLVTTLDPIPLEAFTLQQLQEFHSAIEEAKADIVGLWALRFLINQSAHGKGQALVFNWLYEKGAFTLHPDDTFPVDFAKVPVDIAPSFPIADEILKTHEAGY